MSASPLMPRHFDLHSIFRSHSQELFDLGLLRLQLLLLGSELSRQLVGGLLEQRAPAVPA